MIKLVIQERLHDNPPHVPLSFDIVPSQIVRYITVVKTSKKLEYWRIRTSKLIKRTFSNNKLVLKWKQKKQGSVNCNNARYGNNLKLKRTL